MICSKCEIDKEDDQFYKRGNYRRKQCRACMSQTTNKRVARWRRESKRILMEEFGGKCSICGYNKSQTALQFHHLDPTIKETEVGQYNRSLKRLREEAKKCILVCANCHAELEEKNRAIGEVD